MNFWCVDDAWLAVADNLDEPQNKGHGWFCDIFFISNYEVWLFNFFAWSFWNKVYYLEHLNIWTWRIYVKQKISLEQFSLSDFLSSFSTYFVYLVGKYHPTVWSDY